MKLRFLRTHIVIALALMSPAGFSFPAGSPAAPQGNSATRVAAEMTNGRLSPMESKPGDSVTLRLKDDLKSNGQIVLKKGTLITGVVRTIGRRDSRAHAQSMLEVEWIVPASGTQSMSIALQSVTQLNAGHRDEEAAAFREDLMAPSARPVRLSGDIAAAGGGAVAANPALLSMPSVVAVDHQTSSAIESSLDSAASGPLFKVGHGELGLPGGPHESVDLFSHLNNDTVITSPSKNFEISTGAQMQLLVGITR